MTIHERNLIALAGGYCLSRYGTLTNRMSTAQRGEGPALTVTRATVGWAHTRRGLLIPVQANVPRVSWFDTDGDGVMDEAALLIEPQRTNLFLRSQELDSAAWTKGNVTIAADAQVAPDGTTTADVITEDASSGVTHHIRQVVTISAGNTVVVACFAEANTRDWIRLRADDGVVTDGFEQWFDLANGAKGTGQAVGGGTFSRAHIQRVTGPDGSDWYWCWAAGVVNGSATSITGRCYLATGNEVTTYAGDGSSGANVWGLQCEQGAEAASSPIPTAGSTVTRDADVVSLPYYEPLVDVTLFAKFVELGTIHFSGGSERILQIGDAPSSHIMTANDGDYRSRSTHSTTVGSVVTTPNPTIGQVVEVLATFSVTGTTQFFQAIDGGAVASGSESSTPGALIAKDDATMYLGQSSGGGSLGQTGLIAAGVLRGTGHTIADLRDFLAA